MNNKEALTRTVFNKHRELLDGLINDQVPYLTFSHINDLPKETKFQLRRYDSGDGNKHYAGTLTNITEQMDDIQAIRMLLHLMDYIYCEIHDEDISDYMINRIFHQPDRMDITITVTDTF